MEYSKKQIKSIIGATKKIIKDMKDIRSNFAQIIENNNNYYITDGFKIYKFKKTNTLYNEFLKNNIKIYEDQNFSNTINFEKLINDVLNSQDKINFIFTKEEIKKYLNKLKIAKNYNMIYETTSKYPIHKKINEKYIALNPKWLQDACNVLDINELNFVNDGRNKDCFIGLSIAQTDLITFGILPIRIGTIEIVKKMEKIQNKKIILLSKIKRNLHGKSILLKSHIKEEYKTEAEETKEKSKIDKIYNNIIKLGIDTTATVEKLGEWIWVQTLNSDFSNYLLNNGFKFSLNKLRFYYHEGNFYKGSNKKVSYEELKEIYG